MSFFAFTFGSFGDIVVIVQLVFAFRSFLGVVRGAFSDCKNQVKHLEQSRDIFKLIHSLVGLSAATSSTLSTLPLFASARATTISQSVSECERLMEDIDRILLSCKEKLYLRRLSHGWLGGMMNMLACVRVNKQARTLRQRLQGQIQLFQTLLISS